LDIVNGKKENASFLSSVAALAEKSDRILKIFEMREKLPQSIKLMIKGKWESVPIEDVMSVE
jgi:hypothetical protein